MRVLIIDDEMDIADSTTQLLELENIPAEFVTSVGEVQDAIRSFEPDTILQDINMPRMNILEQVSSLRKLAPRARVFLFTAVANGREQMEATKADGLISKPFSIEDLLAALNS